MTVPLGEVVVAQEAALSTTSCRASTQPILWNRARGGTARSTSMVDMEVNSSPRLSTTKLLSSHKSQEVPASQARPIKLNVLVVTRVPSASHARSEHSNTILATGSANLVRTSP